MLREASVADLLAFDALPQETKDLFELMTGLVAEITDDTQDAMHHGYRVGYEQGYRAGRAMNERDKKAK